MSLNVTMHAPTGASQRIEIGGRLDTHTYQALDQKLAPVLASNVQSLVLDLAGLEYISSAGVRSVFKAVSCVFWVLRPSAPSVSPCPPAINGPAEIQFSAEGNVAAPWQPLSLTESQPARAPRATHPAGDPLDQQDSRLNRRGAHGH